MFACTGPRRGLAGWLLVATASLPALAGATSEGPPVGSPDVQADPLVHRPPQAELPAITVRATPASPTATGMDPIQSTSRIGAPGIERRQADSVFQLMDDLPGVSVQGGVRGSGKRFAIRGFSDSEDVKVEVDGVTKGFEKYRFGGTFIEPDLLKTIEVRRGAQIESGAGAIGGTVSATTRDPSDLLRPGQRWGGRSRLGWAGNDGERHAFAAAYGRPSEGIDLLAARTRREGGDKRLPGGGKLTLSATHMDSDLLKAGWWATDRWKLGISWLRYKDQGLQAYDATGGAADIGAGGFGQVQRRIDDETLALRGEWRDEAGGHEWTTTLGTGRTRVRDHFEPGWSTLMLNHAADDDVDYRQQTLDSRARRRLMNNTGGRRLDVNFGVQAGHAHRSARRVTSDAAINAALYPGGYNRTQPPGTKDNAGVYAQLDWRVQRWPIMPGLRWDAFDSEVEGENADVARASGQSTRARYRQTSPSLTLAYDLQPGTWTLFASAGSGFRPPLLDESFTRGGHGACLDHTLLRRGTPPGVPGYHATSKVAPASQICGDLYRAETSRTLEAGFSTRHKDVLGEGSLLTGKVTAFQARTRHLLESLMAEPGGSGRLIQPGRERRHGIEVEAELVAGSHFARLSATVIRGSTFDGFRQGELLSVPGQTLHLSLGWRPAWGEAVLRWLRAGSQYVIEKTTVKQAGHHLLGASVNWRINPWLDIGVAGENLLDEHHRLTGGVGNGPGLEGPGRNVRISLGARY